MRILVTNDDGIDSVGLHELARAMRPHGEVIVAAPDTEYSGCGAGLGSLADMSPDVHQATISGIDEAWAVAGPPALCVMFARLGAFGGPFDLVVSGINPGANVGRSVYHSGTVGAVLTARTGGMNGVAVSQQVESFSIEGQAWQAALDKQVWSTAATVGAEVVGALIANGLPDDPIAVNVNVPNLPVAEVKGWKHSAIGTAPPRALSQATLEPKAGHEGTFKVKMAWGKPEYRNEDSDRGHVMDGYVALTWLTALAALPDEAQIGRERVAGALDDLLN